MCQKQTLASRISEEAPERLAALIVGWLGKW
jgi:hypothetical protein